MNDKSGNSGTDQNIGQEYGSFRIQPLKDGSNDKGLFLANTSGVGGIRIEHTVDGVHLDFYSGDQKNSSKPIQSMTTSYESLQWSGREFGERNSR